MSENSSCSNDSNKEEFLPLSNIAKIMKDSVDPQLKISLEAKHLMEECVTEFICFITSEASEKCKRERKKTIGSDDLLAVMGHLGFENYVVLLKVFLHKFRQS
jgi:nuclear transcription Y subunit beta